MNDSKGNSGSQSIKLDPYERALNDLQVEMISNLNSITAMPLHPAVEKVNTEFFQPHT
jgi:TRAP-type uncharacterized transport system substrate-binding protein